ncbi:MAG: hypothetical protein Q7S87_10360 [Agitococcus sp.]|nr:hypothetical protein [Agitococcus sp.]MDO9179470.1 hypothetical protein [Agitococcus sp.]
MTIRKYVPISYLHGDKLHPVTLNEAVLATVAEAPEKHADALEVLNAKVHQLTLLFAATTAVLTPSQQDIIASDLNLFPVCALSACGKTLHEEDNSLKLMEEDFRAKDYLFLERAKQRYIHYMQKYPQVAQEVWLALDLADRPGPPEVLNEEQCTSTPQNIRLLNWVLKMLDTAEVLNDWWATHLPLELHKELKKLLRNEGQTDDNGGDPLGQVLYLTRLAWLDWMIAYCRERDL